jgi:6-phosphofructokinase
MKEKLAILVGGGPAPGINSVIAAATIRAALEGVEVIGIQDGFEWLMKGQTNRVWPLHIKDVSRIHFRGGSVIGTSRANPTKDPRHLETVVEGLGKLGVNQLITIGGDDTALSAAKTAERAGDRLRVVHVPKTIDNDLDLPPDIDTFGFQTARHLGAELVKNIMVDAFTTSRWYFIISMGRSVGHLALGIGKAAGATITLIPEEFGKGIRLSTVVDTLVGAIIKRQAEGRAHGVAVISEGVVLSIDERDLGSLDNVERDAHGHVRISEIDVGLLLRQAVKKELASLGIKTTIVSKDIGYELRCADPIPYDMEYTRDLGYCAARFILAGGTGAMVSMQGGRFVPIPFSSMRDPTTGRTRTRSVDIDSARYAIARRYMIRVRRDDFADAATLERLAAAAGMSPADFRTRFEPLTADEPPRFEIAGVT